MADYPGINGPLDFLGHHFPGFGPLFFWIAPPQIGNLYIGDFVVYVSPLKKHTHARKTSTPATWCQCLIVFKQKGLVLKAGAFSRPPSTFAHG